MGERLELVVAGWYNLLTLFPAVAEERCIVADQNNHRDAIAELRQNLLDEPRVGHVEADVNGRQTARYAAGAPALRRVCAACMG